MVQSHGANRVLWVLPHRSQSGDEEVVENGLRCRLLDAVDVRRLPQEIVLGVPEEVLRRHRSDQVIFAQFARQPDRDIYTLSVPCGHDREGRIVYLTALELLTPRTAPMLIPNVEGLPELEAECAARSFRRLQSDRDNWARSVHDMLRAVWEHPEMTSFCNVRLGRSVHPPQWMRGSSRRLPAFLFGLFIVVASIAAAWVICR